jgi:transcriptional regulator with XRE-family HTH domain
MLSKRIRQMRHSMGLSMEKFANLVGVTERSVQNWENSSTAPSALVYNDMCKIYKDFKKQKKVSAEMKKPLEQEAA